MCVRLLGVTLDSNNSVSCQHTYIPGHALFKKIQCYEKLCQLERYICQTTLNMHIPSVLDTFQHLSLYKWQVCFTSHMYITVFEIRLSNLLAQKLQN